MATIIDALAVELSLDPAKFKRGLSDAVDDLKKFKDSSEKHAKDVEKNTKDQAEGFGLITKKIVELGAAYLSFTAIKSFVTDLVNTNVALNSNAAALGVSIERLSAMNNMARMVGSSAQGMAGAIGSIQQQLVMMNQYHMPPSQQFMIGATMLGLPRGAYLGSGVNPESFILSAARAAQAQLRAGTSQAAVSQNLQNVGITDPGMIAMAMQRSPEEIKRYIDEMKKMAPAPEDVKRIQDFNLEMGRFEATMAKLASTMSPLLTAMEPYVRLLTDVLNLISKAASIERPSWWPTMGESVPIFGPIQRGMNLWNSYAHPGGATGSNAGEPAATGSANLPTLKSYGLGGTSFGSNAMPPGAGEQTTISSPSGKRFTVSKSLAPYFQGFINDYEAAGGVIGEHGGQGFRANPSKHPWGGAIDIDQTGRNIRSRGHLSQEVEEALAAKWGLYPGSKFSSPDAGHFEASRELLEKLRSGAVTGRGSTFDDAMTASGPRTGEPGIALPGRGTLGQMFTVTTPDGRKFIARQTDVGPAARTGRSVDINAALRKRMGYSEKNFPTDDTFQIVPYHGLETGTGAGGSGGSWWDRLKSFGGHSSLDMPPSAMLHNQSTTTNNNVSSAETHIGYVTINTQATDPRGIAAEVANLSRNRMAMLGASNIGGGPT